MEVLNYKQLCEEFNVAQNQNGYEEEVRQKAQEICDRRGIYANSIDGQIHNIEGEVGEVNKLINEIKGSCDVTTQENKTFLETICAELSTKMENYIKKASLLKKRFENKKIKVIVFGPKTQGKSQFTRLYTGLSSQVIAVKPTGTDADKTGATSKIVHDSNLQNDEVKIYIELKSKDEILKEINNILSNFTENSVNLVLPNMDNNTGLYSNWENFYRVVSDEIEKQNALQRVQEAHSTMDDFTSKQSYLKHVFDKHSDYSEVNNGKNDLADVSIVQLPQYNDMQNNDTQRYMTVKQITISLNLQHNNIFENFEIFDTKGISDNAGGTDAENMLFDEINKCDAVFSLKSVGAGQSAEEFYANLSNARNRNNVSVPEKFELKHFAILNLWRGISNNSVEDVCQKIKSTDLANTVYVGSLGENDEERNVDNRYEFSDGTVVEPQKFAEYVVVDMLGRITESTRQYDDTLISECGNLAEEIKELKQKLCDKIAFLIVPEPYSCDNAIVDAIEKFQKEALENINNKASELKIQYQKSINQNTTSHVGGIIFGAQTKDSHTPTTMAPITTDVPSGKDIKDINKDIYYMITGKNPSEDSNMELSEKDPVGVALEEIFEGVKGEAGKRVKIGNPGSPVSGNVQTLGSYIDDLSALVFDRIAPNINEKYAPSHPIKEIEDTCNSFLKILWEKFRFNILFDKEFKNGEDYKNNNTRFQSWYELYRELNVDTAVNRLFPILTFDILKSYFAKVERPRNMELLNPIVDGNKLKEALVETYKQFDFKKLIIQKVDDADHKKENIVTTLVANLHTGRIADDLYQLYKNAGEGKLKKIGILNDEVSKRLKSDNKWRVLKEQGEKLTQKEVEKLSIPLVNN